MWLSTTKIIVVLDDFCSLPHRPSRGEWPVAQKDVSSESASAPALRRVTCSRFQGDLQPRDCIQITMFVPVQFIQIRCCMNIHPFAQLSNLHTTYFRLVLCPFFVFPSVVVTSSALLSTRRAVSSSFFGVPAPLSLLCWFFLVAAAPMISVVHSLSDCCRSHSDSLSLLSSFSPVIDCHLLPLPLEQQTNKQTNQRTIQPASLHLHISLSTCPCVSSRQYPFTEPHQPIYPKNP